MTSRDLKPANVMMDEQGDPHITDFGLARREVGDATLTAHGQILGTPAYMSPEQARGDAHHADRRTDVYSLGIILSQLLTGELPFRGSAAAIVHQVVHDEPPRPHTLSTTVSRDLEAICLKCLEKEPQRRYDTAEQVAQDLGRFLRGQTTQARPITRGGRLWRWCRRNTVVAGLATAVVLLLVVGSATSTFFAIRSRYRALEATASARQAERSETSAVRHLYESLTALAQSSQRTGRPGQGIDSLQACAGAAAILPRLGLGNDEVAKLRNLAIPAMVLPDVQLRLSFPVVDRFPLFNGDLSRAACLDNQLNITVRRVVADGGDSSLSFEQAEGMWGLSSDGNLLIFFSRDRHVCLGNVASRQLILDADYTVWSWPSVNLSRDGRVLAIAERQGLVHLHDTTTGRELAAFSTELADPAVCFRPDGKQLAVIGRKSTYVLFYDVASQQTKKLLDHSATTGRLSWHPGGQFLAVACNDWNTYIWDMADNEQVSVLRGHSNRILHMAFNHRGDLIASRSWDGSNRFWEPYTGAELLRIPTTEFRAFH